MSWISLQRNLNVWMCCWVFKHLSLVAEVLSLYFFVISAGVLSLLQALGKAYQALSEYDCRKAIELFTDLPPHQLNTGWVLSQIGRAQFELQEYHEVRIHVLKLKKIQHICSSPDFHMVSCAFGCCVSKSLLIKLPTPFLIDDSKILCSWSSNIFV